MELVVPSTKLGHSLSSCVHSSNQSVSKNGNIVFLSWKHIFNKTFKENVFIFFNSTFEPTSQQSAKNESIKTISAGGPPTWIMSKGSVIFL